MFRLFTFVAFEMIVVNKMVAAYTQISMPLTNGNSTNDGPKIYKALNVDLLFPHSEGNLYTVQPKVELTKEEQHEHKQQLSEMKQLTIYDKEEENRLPPQIHVTPHYEQMDAITLNNKDNNGIIIRNTTNVLGDKKQKQNNMKTKKPSIEYHTYKLEQERQQLEGEQQSVEDLMLAGTGRAAAYRNHDYPFGQVITPLIKTTRQKLKEQQQQPEQQQKQEQQEQYILLPTSATSLSSTLTSLPTVKYPLVAKDNIYQTQQQQYQQPQQQQIHNYIKTYELPNNGGGEITDRFTPGEAVASQQLKKQQSSQAIKTPQNTISVIPSKDESDLYAFPPNNINYSNDMRSNVTKFINSYVPPPSGSSMADHYNQNHVYKGAFTNVAHLPYSYESNNNDQMNQQDIDSYDSIGVLPASAMLAKPGNHHNFQAFEDNEYNDGSLNDNGKEYPTPPTGWLDNHPDTSSEHPTIYNDHYHHYYYEATTKQYDKHLKTFSQPVLIYNNNNNNNNHHHNNDSYVDINHDDDYQHIYPHYQHFVDYTTIPPQESRVKKYSYFYIGRKLWYIPLYFTVWFTFYVLWLIIKSIARHKVNLPNHYVNRRSLNDNAIQQNHDEFINQLSINVWQQIEAFKDNYIK